MIIRSAYTLPSTFTRVKPASQSVLPVLSATCEFTSSSRPHQRHSADPLRQHQSSSPPANEGPDARVANGGLRAQAEGQPADTKPQLIWITPDSPPRPPRKPRRPQSAPLPSISPPLDVSVLPTISQHAEPPPSPPEKNAPTDSPLPPSPVPSETLLPCPPIKHPGFLSRIPRPAQIDEDSISISSSISQRRNSVPTLRSYARPSTAPSRDEPHQPPRAGRAAVRPRLSLLSMTAHRPTAETRSRSKSSIAFSDAAFATRHKGRSLELTVEEKGPVAESAPPSCTSTEAGPLSEISSSPPVTATTLNDASTSSFTVYESPQGQEKEGKPAEESTVEKKWFWEPKDKPKREPHVDRAEDTPAEPEPEPAQLVTLTNTSSTPALLLRNPSKLDVKSHTHTPTPTPTPTPTHIPTIRDREDKPPPITAGPKPISRKTGGSIKRVWRSFLVARV